MEGEIVQKPTPAEKAVRVIEKQQDDNKVTVIETTGRRVLEEYRIVKFRGRVMILLYEPYAHFVPLSKDMFDELIYPLVGGLPRSRIGDVYAYTLAVCEDLSPNSHLIAFGGLLEDAVIEADTDIGALVKHKPTVWDMRELETLPAPYLDQCVWRSPHAKYTQDESANVRDENHKLKFIMALAGGDDGLYDDIMQSIAPLVMEKKPDGVIWWVGSGANGKSTLMDAIYRLFPRALAGIGIKRLVDGRDTPGLNGVLGNVVKESADGRIEDTEAYKCLGTHENFSVHRFHSQESQEINGNIHTIFSGNSIPVFADKGYSIRRRTFIIPFNQQFETDPDFEAKTFTPEFFGALATEICYYANRIKRQGYRYKWSAFTTGVKKEYDREASNTEEYANQIVYEGVVAFDSFMQLRNDYENWCAENGYVPLGITNLRKAITAAGFERTTKRAEGNTTVDHIYRLKTVDGTQELQRFNLNRIGLYTTNGFKIVPDPAPVPEMPRRSVLKGNW